MSVLSYNDLISLVDEGVITGVKPESINGASIDVHLGSILLTEAYSDSRMNIVDIAKRGNFSACRLDITGHHYDMRPEEFLLASTVEKFYLPSNIAAEFKLKSSGARSGLNNALATWCDPGWNGSTLTLELKNQLRYHSIRLTDGMPIGQMVFRRVEAVPEDRDYAARGRYNNDSSVQAVKP